MTKPAPPVAARRLYPKPGRTERHGPWHVLRTDPQATLCGQYMSGKPPASALETRALAGGPPADGALCTRCWDRWEGRRQPDRPLSGTFQPPDLSPDPSGDPA